MELWRFNKMRRITESVDLEETKQNIKITDSSKVIRQMSNAVDFNQQTSKLFLRATQSKNAKLVKRVLDSSREDSANFLHLQCILTIKKTFQLNFVTLDVERTSGSCISFTDWLEGIYIAKKENCSEVLDLLFNYEKFVHGRTKDGWTALHLTVLNCMRQMETRELEKVEILLKSGRFDVNALTDELETVFHFACRSVPTQNFSGEFRMIKQKFRLHEVNGDQKNSPLQAPLMFECTKRCVSEFRESIVSDFLNGYKLDIIDRDKDGKTALVLTKQSNNADIVSTMDEKLLLTAVRNGDWNTVEIHLKAALKRQKEQVTDNNDLANSLPKVACSENSICASVWLEAVWIAYSQAYKINFPQRSILLRNRKFSSIHLYDRDTNSIQIENLIEMLLKHGVDPSVRNSKGETALMLARDENIVNRLLKLRRNSEIHLDIDAVGKCGETALMKATRRGDAEIAAALLRSKLLTAIENEDKIFVKALMDKYMKTRIAVSHLSNQAIERIKEHGLNFTTWTDAARLAMQKSSKEILNILLNDDFIVKCQEGRNADPILHRLFEEEEEAKKPLIEFLLESGELNVNSINFNGETALISCFNPRKDIPLLLRYGADVNHKNNSGETLLMIESERGDSASVQMILNWTRERRVWCDLDARDLNGQTTLIRAVRGKHTDIVALLLNAGASINLPDHRGFTPLHHALCEAFITHLWLRFDDCSFGFKRWIEFGDFPGDFEKLQKMRETIFNLFEAGRIQSKVNEKMLKIIELLLEREDVDVNAVQCDGFSPLDIVEASVAEIPLSIKEALRKKGANLNVYRHVTTPLTSNSDVDVTCANFILHRLAMADVGFEIISEKTKGFEILREGFQKLSAAVKNEMVSTKDRKGRTPLHSAVIACDKDYYTLFKSENDLEIKIVKLLISFGCKVNETDIYGRTPLHYANNKHTQKLLLSHGADASIKDINGISATETFPKREIQYFSNGVRNIIKSAVKRIGETCSFRQHRDRMVLQRHRGNVDRGKSIPWCEHLNPITILEHVWKNGDYAYRLPSSTIITEKVKNILDDIAVEIKRRDSRFEVKPVLIGSAYEGTKINLPDEFDFNLVLTKFSELCEVCSSPELPPGYVRLRRKQRKVRAAKESEFEEFFNDGGILITEKVKEQFNMVLANVVTYIDSQRNYEWDWHFSFVHSCYDRLKPVITLNLEKMKFDPSYKNTVIKISVDITPCIRIDCWWPDEAITNVSDDIKAAGCHLIFDDLQRLYPWVPYSESYARISFAPVESEMIRRSCDTAKQAYMIGKQFLQYGRCKSTYFLKNSLLYCIEVFARNPEIFNKTDNLWLESLMKCHLEFVKQDFCPLYFMPTCCFATKLYMKWISEDYSEYPDVCLSAFKLYCITSMDYSTWYMQSLSPNFIFENFEPMEAIKDLCDSASKKLVECDSRNCDGFCGKKSWRSKRFGEWEHGYNREIMKMLCKDDFTSFESFDLHETT